MKKSKPKLTPFDRETGQLNVVIDTPKGSRNKFKFDSQRRMFKLSGVLPVGASFPFDFGYIPSTQADDGDPLDVLILMDEPAFTGCLVPSHLIGKTLRSINVAAHAGTAFDGEHLFQLAEDRIQKIDPKTGRVLATIPAPGGGGDSGLTWAEGSLWVGQYRDRKIHQVDPETGAILRTIESTRFVTGVSWIDGELWHGTWEGDESDLRRVDPQTGKVLEMLEMPPGVIVSGLESDGGDQFFCGGGRSGKVRLVRRIRKSRPRTA